MILCYIDEKHSPQTLQIMLWAKTMFTKYRSLMSLFL